jgi:hypothetical protein
VDADDLLRDARALDGLGVGVAGLDEDLRLRREEAADGRDDRRLEDVELDARRARGVTAGVADDGLPVAVSGRVLVVAEELVVERGVLSQRPERALGLAVTRLDETHEDRIKVSGLGGVIPTAAGNLHASGH